MKSASDEHSNQGNRRLKVSGGVMSKSQVQAPSVELTSFACPHCGVHAAQHWFNTYVGRISDGEPTPNILSGEKIENIEKEINASRNEDIPEMMVFFVEHFRRLLLGEPFIKKSKEAPYNPPCLENVFVSQCSACDKTAIWLHDRLIYPNIMTGSSPNPDLSGDVQRDYEEARRILDQSPWGERAPY